MLLAYPHFFCLSECKGLVALLQSLSRKIAKPLQQRCKAPAYFEG